MGESPTEFELLSRRPAKAGDGSWLYLVRYGARRFEILIGPVGWVRPRRSDNRYWANVSEVDGKSAAATVPGDWQSVDDAYASIDEAYAAALDAIRGWPPPPTPPWGRHWVLGVVWTGLAIAAWLSAALASLDLWFAAAICAGNGLVQVAFGLVLASNWRGLPSRLARRAYQSDTRDRKFRLAQWATAMLVIIQLAVLITSFARM